MKITLKQNTEKEVKTLHVDAGVRYWEDADVNGIEDTDGDLIPCREGDRWKPIIDLESGKILNWKQGTEALVHYKVCDDGIYTLKDEDGNVVVEREDYVPKIMCIEDEDYGFGDYIILRISVDGSIQDWNPILDCFTNQEED